MKALEQSKIDSRVSLFDTAVLIHIPYVKRNSSTSNQKSESELTPFNDRQHDAESIGLSYLFKAVKHVSIAGHITPSRAERSQSADQATELL